MRNWLDDSLPQPEVGQERRDQPGMEELRGEIGHSHGAAASWAAAAVDGLEDFFFLYQFIFASLPAAWEHRPSL